MYRKFQLVAWLRRVLRVGMKVLLNTTLDWMHLNRRGCPIMPPNEDLSTCAVHSHRAVKCPAEQPCINVVAI